MACLSLFMGCTRKQECLVLKIASQKLAYVQDEPFAIAIEFQNHCNREVVVMNPSWEFPPVYCELRNQAGEAPEKAGSLKWGRRIEPQEYIQNQILIKPHQSHTSLNATNYKWRERLWHLKPGTYTQWCEYEMLKDAPEVRGPLKDKFWFGHIKSNVIEVVIKKSSKQGY